MTDASKMRGYLKLFEAAAPDYVGPKASDTISYNAEQTKGEITKITATLKAKDSEKYTKLGRNLVRITELTEELKTLQAETKGDAREMVADLFHAEDAACTRVVDTVGFMFHMTKDPKASASVSYAKVLEELQAHLTPELINILETLKSKHTGAPVQKAASLSATDKAAPVAPAVAQESINEGLGDKLKGFFAKLLSTIQQWGKSYDAKLDALKSQMAMSESVDNGFAIEEDDSCGYRKGDEVMINAPRSEANGQEATFDSYDSESGMFKVYLSGTGFHGYFKAEELKPLRLGPLPD